MHGNVDFNKGKFFIPVKDQGDSFLYGIPAVGTSHWNSSSTGSNYVYYCKSDHSDICDWPGNRYRCWMVVNSFGIAITTFVGQNYGAGKIQRMRKSVKVCLLMSYGAAILVSAALYGFAEPLYRLFTTDSNVVRIGADMMHFLLPSYFMYVVIGILSGALRGAGRVLVPMLLTCGGVCLIRIAWMFGVFPVYSGIKTIMLSYPVSWGITAVLFIIYYFKKFPKTEEQILQ